MHMPPPDADEHEKGDGPDDEAANISLSALWRRAVERRQDRWR